MSSIAGRSCGGLGGGRPHWPPSGRTPWRASPTPAKAAAGKTPRRASPVDEDYWSEIARAFDVDRTLINLNNGGCSPAPAHVLDAMIRDLRFSNEIPV